MLDLIRIIKIFIHKKLKNSNCILFIVLENKISLVNSALFFGKEYNIDL